MEIAKIGTFNAASAANGSYASSLFHLSWPIAMICASGTPLNGPSGVSVNHGFEAALRTNFGSWSARPDRNVSKTILMKDDPSSISCSEYPFSGSVALTRGRGRMGIKAVG